MVDKNPKRDATRDDDLSTSTTKTVPPMVKTVPRVVVPLKYVQEALAEAVVIAPTPHLTYHGGPVLHNVEVFTIFWGSFWQGAPQNGLIGQINNFFDFIVDSVHMEVIHQYSVPSGQIGHGRRIGSTSVTNSEPGQPIAGGGRQVTDAQIQQALQSWIANSIIPSPSPNTLYFVYLPQNVTSLLPGNGSSCVNYCGYHLHTNNVFYAVMPYPQCGGCQYGPSQLSSLTKVSSHELVEAITDPTGISWFDDNGGNEIGDICNTQLAQLGGFTIQKEWSNQHNACIYALNRLGMIVYGSIVGGGYQTIFGSSDMGQGSGAIAWLIGDVNVDHKADVVQMWNSNP